MTLEDFKNMVDTIPHLPGVYRFLDEEDTILYVGKAKDLRNRLSNYFGDKKQIAFKTRVLTKNANRIEFTIVETEHDALLMENTFIKKFQPRYNVSLKDGKSYSYIVIKNERFPRVFFTRKVIKDGSSYFGPYTSKGRVKLIFDVVKKLFPLRTCAFSLTENNIQQGKFKLCLEYHIKNCMGPCEGLETENSYNDKIDQIKYILKGNFARVREYMLNQMADAATELNFELAQQYKERLTLLEDYQAKSTVVSSSIKDLDVFTIRSDEKMAFVNYLKIVDGALINTDTLEIEKKLEEEDIDVLNFVIPVIRERYQSIAPEVATTYPVVLEHEILVTLPKIGDKRKLIELSQRNLDYYITQKRKSESERKNKQSPAERILTTLKNDLRMQDLPLHIECFDNSNIQGTNPVASCVVFRNAKPFKKDYRHFKIKTVEGPNDFASMEEVVYRRYARMLEEKQALPNLVIIDGGKGQLSAAVKSLNELGILDQLVVVGIAKRLEEIFFPEDPIPLYINKKSESLKLIQHCRNEAHRFALGFHRDLRSKNFLSSELTSINGIGDKTAQKLITSFGSVKKIREANREEIEAVAGKKNAAMIFQHFTQQLDDNYSINQDNDE
ncbi:MAG: excinuclease ABC subunit UvrC [Saprospiraceae bacterium]|nr:excinuclease ABC subunit UvrC [Saprospiraceae bacterium]MBK8850822.1 excinuclease ABC subunit UvrC [Saprospiraceae bacterium]